MPPPSNAPVLELRDVTKHFPGARALSRARLSLRAGEVHALLGENGAGKSTLLKLVAGVHQPDEGMLLLDGEPVRLGSPREALARGIAVIHQELSLVPDLSIAENVFLGAEPRRFLLPDFAAMARRSAALLARLGLHLDPRTPVRALSVADQQRVEIARALRSQVKVLCMDEPTAALSQREATQLFALVRELAAEGVAVVYVSHRLAEVFALCTVATVLRDGVTVAELSLAGETEDALVRRMVGRDVQELYPEPVPRSEGPPLLEVRGLTLGRRLRGVDLTVREGELVGVGGLVGAGRTELLRAIFGADRAEAGEVRVAGERVTLGDPVAATAAGLGFLTEDRKAQGLLLGRSIGENTTLASLARISPGGLLQASAEQRAALGAVERVRVKMGSLASDAASLSGGNQQKVLLARWLLRGFKVLLVDEPTRGIDVGSRAEIYLLLRQLAADGLALLVVSSELQELCGLCDRVLVMADGRIQGEVARSAASEERILSLATPRGSARV